MKKPIQVAALSLITMAAACRSAVGWDNREALASESIEVQLDEDARPLEVEYHVSPERVPASVRAAMDELHAGGQIVAAEKEYVGSDLYWELTKEIDGREVEAMFRPDGTLHSEEVEVSAGDVPQVVQESVRARMAGTVTKWEEIRDGQRNLVEYHAKVAKDGAKYKVIVTTDGAVIGVLREIPAEIEVPVP